MSDQNTTPKVTRHRTRGVALAAVLAAATGGLLLNATLNSGPHTAKALPVPVAGTLSTEGTAEDPRGPLPFGTKVWENSAGQTCAVLGHRVGDRVTGSDGEGDFQPGPGDGGCVDLDKMTGDLDVRRDGEFYYGRSEKINHATVIWGLAKPGIRAVEARAKSGQVRVSKVSERGVFLMVFPGAITGQVDVIADTDTGQKTDVSLAAMPEEVRDRVLNPRTAEQAQREMADQAARDGEIPTGASTDHHP